MCEIEQRTVMGGAVRKTLVNYRQWEEYLSKIRNNVYEIQKLKESETGVCRMN